MALRVDEEQTVAVFLISGRKGSCMPRLLLGAAALALVLAGCGADPESTPSPDVTLTTPVDASPSASPAPTLPAAAQADTKAGAIAFVKHYIAAFNEAQSAGETDYVRMLSSGECGECTKVADGLDEIYADGGRLEGGELEAGPALAEENITEGRWLVLVRVTSGPQTFVASSSAKPKSMPGGQRSMRFTLERTEDAWRVAAWSRG